MTTRRCITISISPELHAVAEQLLTTGRYGNFSEVVRAALRLLNEREQEFRSHCDERGSTQPKTPLSA